MMAFLREPPAGVVPDAYMYTQALHSLAQDPFHWNRAHARGARAGAGAGAPATAPASGGAPAPLTGPRAALALVDEMASRGVRGTRVTLSCVLLACAQLRDYREARRRFAAHVASGGEIGADVFNCLFKAAWSAGAFASEARAIADEMEAAMEFDARCEPNAHTELTLRRAGSSGDAYTPERAVANDLLVRFGFDSEPAPETPWAPADERRSARDETGEGRFGEDERFATNDERAKTGETAFGKSTDEGARIGARREGRRWNR